MVKKQGLWVHTGKLPPGFDAVGAIRDDREERIRKLAVEPVGRIREMPVFPGFFLRFCQAAKV
jgi:hypothetical protein